MGTLTQEERLARAQAQGEFAAALRRREELGKVVPGFFHHDEETGLRDHALYRGMWQDLAEAWCERFPRRKKTVAQETGRAWDRMRKVAKAPRYGFRREG